MKLDISEFLKMSSLELRGCISNFNKVKINSKEVNYGDVFVAIKGERSDGHNFIDEAVEKGAIAIVTERDFLPREQVLQIKVESTRKFLVDLGKFAREKLSAKVVGITGSAGKTTTKEMIKLAFSSTFSVSAPEGNLNTDISLPLFLVNECSGEEEYVILEMGIQKAGDMDILVESMRPEIVVITNIGESHTEFLGDKYGVLKEKFKLVEYVCKTGGRAYLNADDELQVAEAKKYGDCIRFYGFSRLAKLRAELGSLELEAMSISVNGKKYAFPFSGMGLASNVLAAFSLCADEGIAIDRIYEKLKKFKPQKGRGELIKLPKGIMIVDESYNSNPVSLRSSVEMLSKTTRPVLLIIGDMLELGESSEKLHFEIGEYLANINPYLLITYGYYSRCVEQGLISVKGSTKAVHFDEKDALEDYIRKLEIPENSVIFIKGSRAMKMETVIEQLKKRYL